MANRLNIESVASKPRLWSRILMYFRSKRQAVKIMKALNEAERIHSGKSRL